MNNKKDDRYEKTLRLFLQQKQLLDTFLSHRAITQAQYDKSYGDLKKKMEIRDEDIRNKEIREDSIREKYNRL